jgi:hypothetical protein
MELLKYLFTIKPIHGYEYDGSSSNNHNIEFPIMIKMEFTVINSQKLQR